MSHKAAKVSAYDAMPRSAFLRIKLCKNRQIYLRFCRISCLDILTHLSLNVLRNVLYQCQQRLQRHVFRSAVDPQPTFSTVYFSIAS